MEKTVESEKKRRKNVAKNVKPILKFKNKMGFKLNMDNKGKTILVISVIMIVCILVINNYISLGIVLNKNIDSSDVVQVELQTSNNKIIPFGDQVLVYNKGKITSYNGYGKNTWEIVLEDSIGASISTAGEYIQMVDKDKSIVYVYKNKYETARIKVDGKIYSANINKKGISIIEYSSNGSKTALGVYDHSGDMKYNIKLNNKIIGKYELSDNSKYLSYVDVDVSGISAHTSVNLIDLSKDEGEAAVINAIHTIDNGLIYNIYWTGNNIVARYEEGYIIYNTLSKKKEFVTISDKQIINVGEYAKRYAYIGMDKNGRYSVNIGRMNSDGYKTVSIDEAPKYFKYKNGIAYVCYDKKIEAYNNFGIKLKKYDSDMVITDPIIFNSGRSLAMTISNKLIMFTI